VTYIFLKVSQEVETHPSVDGPFRLGEWLVDPRLNRLTRGEESIQIELKMMDVLVCLAGHPGELVERQQLIDTVWATEFLSENILPRAVAELRNALGEDARNPSFIETIHRRRYRLIAKLGTFTNLRAVRDPDSPTGWMVEVGPFPGWETVPTW
jgi:DNA-binding winged helix-turn-helix (wHTH) protein